MITLLAFAFVLGVLVFVHELGHFLAAKRVGIKVLKFQLGFNPTIVSFRRGDTVYSIGALPLGGYVKMAGENPDEPRSGRSDEFLSKSKWERFQVLIMGPAMNLLLAVVLLAVVLYRGAEVPAFDDQPPVVGAVAAGSPAEKADIRPGDLITSIADREVTTWEQRLRRRQARGANREIPIGLIRDGAKLVVKVTPTWPRVEAAWDRRHRSPAERPPEYPRGKPRRAGRASGSQAGRPRPGGERSADHLFVSAQERDRATSGRADHRVDTERRCSADPDSDARQTRRHRVDRDSDCRRHEEHQARRDSGRRDEHRSQCANAGLIFRTVWDLITRETSPKQLMGPVAIAQLSGESAQLGWIALFSLMASISLNLGLLNLLPIPVLDGGHIFIMALEGVARRDFSSRVKEKMLLAGFVMLMMLMVTVIYNDLTRISWIERLMPWR